MIKNVLCAWGMNEHHKELIRKRFPEASIHFCGIGEATFEDAKDAEIVFGNIDINFFPKMKNLKWVHLSSSGTDGYRGKIPEGVLFSNSTGAYGVAIGEHLLAMTMSIMKCFPQFSVAKTKHQWSDRKPVKTMNNAYVLILGLGDIGQNYARLAKAMGAHVVGVRRAHTECPEFVDEVYLEKDLEKLLPKADVVSLSLPNTPATTNYLTKERIGLMKDDSILLNVGRGSSIDENTLIEALQEGKFFGVGLDVFKTEPLPENNPLWDIDRVLITPHNSGYTTHPDTEKYIAELFIANATAYINGNPLITPVDPKTGYLLRK